MAGLGGWVIAEILYLSIISVVGTVGNLLVILAVLTTPSLRQRTNFFIFILAVCDLCTACILIPFFIICLGFGMWPFRNESWCVFLGYITLWCLGWSVTTLALIAANRYLSITRPKFTYYKLCSNLSLALSCFGQAVLGLLVIMLPTFLGVGSVGFNSILGHCSYKYGTFKDWIYTLVLFLSGVVSTGIVIPAYYALTFYIFRKARLNVRTSVQRSLSSTDVSNRKRGRFVISRDEIRLTKKLLLLFVVFLLCWLPYSMVVFLDSDMSVPVPAQRVTNLLLWSNSAFNPFLYAWMMRRFRLAYKRLLTCNCFKRCRQVTSEGSIRSEPASTPETLNQRSIWL